MINDLGKKLVGKNALQHRKLWRELWGANFGNGMAIGGIDMALQDVRGQALGLSIAELYGDRVRDQIPAYASAPNYIQGKDHRKTYPDEGAQLVADGFRALKIRLGGDTLAADIQAATALREAVGPDVRLMVDGNGGFTMGPAIRMGRALDELGYYFFEEPLPQAGYAGYPELTSALEIPIAAGEVLNSRADALELIDRRAMRIIQPDVSLCGGIGELSHSRTHTGRADDRARHLREPVPHRAGREPAATEGRRRRRPHRPRPRHDGRARRHRKVRGQSVRE